MRRAATARRCPDYNALPGSQPVHPDTRTVRHNSRLSVYSEVSSDMNTQIYANIRVHGKYTLVR